MDNSNNNTVNPNAYVFWMKDLHKPDTLFGAGSGFMVARNVALTARHVIACHSQHMPSNDWGIRNPDEFEVVTTAGEFKIKEIIPHPRLDLAILILAQAKSGPNAILVDGLGIHHSDALRDPSCYVDARGYSRYRDGDGPHGGRVDLRIPGGLRELDDVQITPSLPKGLSGGPLCINQVDNYPVIGLNYLGSDPAATSRAYLAPVIIRFLKNNGCDYTAIGADEVLSDVLLSATKQNHTIKKTVIMGQVNGPVGDNNQVTYNQTFHNKRG